jgi:pseudouridine-5'-phosphate glycosidase
LLDHLAKQSGGRTLETNVALLVANARVAARIAVAYARIETGG